VSGVPAGASAANGQQPGRIARTRMAAANVRNLWNTLDAFCACVADNKEFLSLGGFRHFSTELA
jgi:hypothetical protein